MLGEKSHPQSYSAMYHTRYNNDLPYIHTTSANSSMIVIEVTNPSILWFEDGLPRKKLITWTVNLVRNLHLGRVIYPRNLLLLFY